MIENSLRPVPADSIKHGTISGYNRDRCRCDLCRGAALRTARAALARHKAGSIVRRPAQANCVPVRVRGVEYPSIAMAAEALGITPGVVSRHLATHGHADLAGLGQRSPRDRGMGFARPCVIHGRRFPSRSAAARYLGIALAHLSRRLVHGMTPSYSQFLLRKLMEADARAARGGAGQLEAAEW